MLTIEMCVLDHCDLEILNYSSRIGRILGRSNFEEVLVLTTWSRRLFFAVGMVVLAGLVSAGTAYCQTPVLINLYFDENCHGLINGFAGTQPLPCSMMADPGPGGLANALFYNLISPPGLVAGDLLVNEPGNGLSDLLRFNPTLNGGGVFVYSDVEPGDPKPDLADIGFPTAFNTNQLAVLEVGPEGNNGIIYQPVAGQPGFVAGAAAPVVYHFASDAPEPATAGFLLLGGAAMLLINRRRATLRNQQLE
jgi:hypothetical protein